MALKDILTSGKYADDMVLSLPDGTTASVGEMRSMAAEERRALVARSQALEAAEAGVLTRVNTLRQNGLLDENMQPVSRVTTRQVEDHISSTTGMDENDPLFGPLVKETKAQIAAIKSASDAEIAKLRAEMGAVSGATRQAIQGYLGDNYASQFSTEVATLPESIRSGVTLEQAVAFATSKRLMDEQGRLDIRGAVDRLTWDARKADEMAKVTTQKAELDENRKMLAQMQRPGSVGPRAQNTGFKTTDDKGRTLSLDEAIAAAANDDQIWGAAAQYLN